MYKTANIFCDASINLDTKTACSGTIITNEDATIEFYEFLVKQHPATNNSSEIMAVLIGIQTALMMRRTNPEYQYFNLFSDSKLCIYGLREWVFMWANRQDENGNILGTSREPVANQEYFKNIVRLIVDFDLNVHFYHQKGHCNVTSIGRQKARDFFIGSNYGICPEILGIRTDQIIEMNKKVDRDTRSVLYSQNEISYELTDPFKYFISPADMEKYKKLIGTTKI